MEPDGISGELDRTVSAVAEGPEALGVVPVDESALLTQYWQVSAVDFKR